MPVAAIDPTFRDTRDRPITRARWWRSLDPHDAVFRERREVGAAADLHIVRPTVQAIDREIGLIVELIAETLRDDSPDKGPTQVLGFYYRNLRPLLPHGPLHRANDVAPLPDGSKGLLPVRGHPPSIIFTPRKIHALQSLEPPNEKRSVDELR